MPSANRHKAVSPSTASHVSVEFPHEDLMIVEGATGGVESTIIKVGDGGGCDILRPGLIEKEDVELLGLECTYTPLHVKEGKLTESAGQQKKHYSPSKECYILEGDEDLKGKGWAVLDIGAKMSRVKDEVAFYVNLGRDKLEVGGALYGVLREADVEAGVQRVGVVWGGGEAVEDRVWRASEGKWWKREFLIDSMKNDNK